MKEQEPFETEDSKQNDENTRPEQDLLVKEKELYGDDLERNEASEKSGVLEKNEADIPEEQKNEKMLLTQIVYKALLLFVICAGILLYKTNNEKIGICVGLLASMFAILNFLDINYITFIDFYKKITKK